jgi:hypothetical protein
VKKKLSFWYTFYMSARFLTQNTLWAVLLVFFTYHSLRDILQILDIHTFISDLYVTHDQWCSPGCDYVTIPFELVGLVGSYFALVKKRVGIAGWIAIITLPFWPITVFLP